MRKVCPILTAVLCLTLLAGCGSESDNIPEASSVSEDTVSKVSVTESSESEVTEETEETEISTEPEISTEAVIEESDSLETEGIIVIPQEPAPDNKVVYEITKDIPEFPMSLDGINEYEVSTVAQARTEIKAMLECSASGGIPYVENNGYEYASRRLENIKVESWSVVDEKYEDYRYEATVTLDISESSVDEVPVGTADYLFIYTPGEDRAFLPLRRVGELDEERLLPYYGEEKEYLNFCNTFTAYFSDLFLGDEVTDFSYPDLSPYGESYGEAVFNAMICAKRYYPGLDYIMSYSDFDEALKRIYGFSADTLKTKETGYYNTETDTVEIPGRGTYWVCGYLSDESYDEESQTRTITIDYYEDDFHLVRSQTYRYTVRENEDGSLTMMKMERIFNSDKGILGGCI
ncbi:MAG: hypothetical protein ACI4JJ_02445 [Huintestinicola sp.]